MVTLTEMRPIDSESALPLHVLEAIDARVESLVPKIGEHACRELTFGSEVLSLQYWDKQEWWILASTYLSAHSARESYGADEFHTDHIFERSSRKDQQFLATASRQGYGDLWTAAFDNVDIRLKAADEADVIDLLRILGQN